MKSIMLGMLALGAALAPRGETPSPIAPPGTSSCAPGDLAGPEYYAFPLAPTGRVPGTGLARGRADVTFEGSPFPVALTADGSYAYTVAVTLERMRPPREGVLVAWVTTPELDRVERLGALGEDLRIRGPVSWNKFLLVITLEESDAPDAGTWSGPIVFRGMSRSGAMHTMIGHGPFQQENCAAYGFGR